MTIRQPEMSCSLELILATNGVENFEKGDLIVDYALLPVPVCFPGGKSLGSGRPK